VSNKFFQAKAYLSYWLDAVDEHSLHSPFYFDFYTRVVKKNKKGTPLEHAEKLRAQLLKDQRFLTEPDLGSGSSTKRQISRLAQSSLSPVSISSLYSDMADYFKAKKILELGTSFGINALYLASKPERSLTTFEGTADVADIARLTFEFTNTKNIQFIQGNIDVTLKEHLHSVRKLDLILMDLSSSWTTFTIRQKCKKHGLN
jgi:predicted O-methyltransferase YrrM